MSWLQKIDQLSLVVRFVDIDGIIHGEFLGFLSLERITGEAKASAILDANHQNGTWKAFSVL